MPISITFVSVSLITVLALEPQGYFSYLLMLLHVSLHLAVLLDVRAELTLLLLVGPISSLSHYHLLMIVIIRLLIKVLWI
jgi:hypothetical protein